MSLTYRLCKAKIEKGQYESKEKMQEMLDVFLIGERIIIKEYQELTALLEQKEAEKEGTEDTENTGDQSEPEE